MMSWSEHMPGDSAGASLYLINGRDVHLWSYTKLQAKGSILLPSEFPVPSEIPGPAAVKLEPGPAGSLGSKLCAPQHLVLGFAIFVFDMVSWRL